MSNYKWTDFRSNTNGLAGDDEAGSESNFIRELSTGERCFSSVGLGLKMVPKVA